MSAFCCFANSVCGRPERGVTLVKRSLILNDGFPAAITPLRNHPDLLTIVIHGNLLFASRIVLRPAQLTGSRQTTGSQHDHPKYDG